MFDHEIIYQQEIKSTVFIKTELVITIKLKLDSQFPKKKKKKKCFILFKESSLKVTKIFLSYLKSPYCSQII